MKKRKTKNPRKEYLMRDQSRKFKRDYKTEKFEGGKLNIETNKAVKFLFYVFLIIQDSLQSFVVNNSLLL